MRALVIGSGKMGVAAAFDLLLDPQTERVGLVGRGAAALQRAGHRLADARVSTYPVAVEDPQLIAIMREFDVGILALPDRHSSYQAVEAAIAAGLDIVDILEEYHRCPDTSETEGLALAAGLTLAAYGESLHGRARARGVTLLDGFGFAPGLSNVVVGGALARLDKPLAATARVGGIPDKAAAARHPLGYMVTWSFHHVLREYMIKPLVRRGGLAVLADARSGRETFRFRDAQRDELLECAITPGMPSLMLTRPDLPEFAEKTVRWPGHYAAIDLLDACGLLAVEPLATAAGTLVPREVFAAIVTPRLAPGAQDRDVCVMFNTIVGERGGARVCIEQRMWAEPDAQNDFTAMAKVTGFPAAIGARWLAQGKIRGGPGIVAPEDGVVGDTYPLFLAELARRGIVIEETEQEIAREVGTA